VTLQQAFELALQYHQQGQWHDADSIYRQILQVDSQHSQSLHYLGVLAHQQGDHAMAIEWIQKALDLHPEYVDAFHNLGEVHRAAGHFDEAIIAYRKGMELSDEMAGVHYNIGECHRLAERDDDAILAFQKAIELQSHYPEAWLSLGNLFRQKVMLKDSIDAFQTSIQQRPNYPEAYNNLANTLRMDGRLEDAIAALRQALHLRPNYAEACCNLGCYLMEDRKLEEAFQFLQQALSLNPLFPEVSLNLGNLMCHRLQIPEAIAFYRQALKLDPKYSDVRSSLLFTLHYDASISPQRLTAEHRAWDDMHGMALRSQISPHPNDRDFQRRLRVGYVSPDFCLHSVSYFIENLLEHHDRKRVEVFCYSIGVKEDAVTERLRSYAEHWRDIRHSSADQVADLIREDVIDILVDLAGHTSSTQMAVFARKPAPVQVSWLGYPNTTGLSAMDYRMTDEMADPIGKTEAFSTETLIRLPYGAWSYRPYEGAPSVMSAPCLKNGSITYGCFNNYNKVNDSLLDLWAKILLATSGSVLLLKSSSLSSSDPVVLSRIRERMEKAGVHPDRLRFLDHTEDTSSHLACYAMVDIALDTFPYNGTTTTCEALWMGVPVVTLAGESHYSRVGASLLHQLEFDNWIANAPEEYAKIAVEKALDHQAIQQTREGMRDRMRNSRLLEGYEFARDVEVAYQDMWQHRCMA
jgi:protein O-GlcNAc transferase